MIGGVGTRTRSEPNGGAVGVGVVVMRQWGEEGSDVKASRSVFVELQELHLEQEKSQQKKELLLSPLRISRALSYRQAPPRRAS